MASVVPRRPSSWRLAIGTALLLLGIFWGHCCPVPATLKIALDATRLSPATPSAAIAARFGVPVDALIQINNITDPSLIHVGRSCSSQPMPPHWHWAWSRPRRAMRRPVRRWAASPRTNQDGELLAALNGITITTRLWPGQPVAIPADQAPPAPLRFGALTGIKISGSIVQGRTGRVKIEADRQISLRADSMTAAAVGRAPHTDSHRGSAPTGAGAHRAGHVHAHGGVHHGPRHSCCADADG